MFVIKENFSHEAEISVLRHTAEDTAEKCFFGFYDGAETSLVELKSEYEEYAECEENPATIEGFFRTDAKTLAKKRLFNVWDAGDETRLFGYDDEPDWNELLQHRYGSVTSPRAAEAKYFIDEV